MTQKSYGAEKGPMKPMYEIQAVYARPFNALSLEERLFLYTVRHWARRRRHDAAARQQTSFTDRSQGRVEVRLDAFLRCFMTALPEPFVVQAPHCRCALQFHEATLLDMFQGLRSNNVDRATRALSDFMSASVIETLIDHLRPVLSEIDMAVAELR